MFWRSRELGDTGMSINDVDSRTTPDIIGWMWIWELHFKPDFQMIVRQVQGAQFENHCPKSLMKWIV